MQGFVRICETLGEDSQGFARLWEMIHKILGEDLQGFVRLLEGICKDLQDFAKLWERIRKES